MNATEVIQAQCPHCDHIHPVKRRNIGRNAGCKECGNKFRIEEHRTKANPFGEQKIEPLPPSDSEEITLEDVKPLPKLPPKEPPTTPEATGYEPATKTKNPVTITHSATFNEWLLKRTGFIIQMNIVISILSAVGCGFMWLDYFGTSLDRPSITASAAEKIAHATQVGWKYGTAIGSTSGTVGFFLAFVIGLGLLHSIAMSVHDNG